MVKHDLALILRAGRQAGIPVIVGSAGTAGGDSHVDWTLEIAREVAAEHGLTLRTAVIYCEQDKNYLKGLLRENRINPLSPAPHVDEGVIDRSSRIVGMTRLIGPPEFQSVFDMNPHCCRSRLFVARFERIKDGVDF